MNTDDHNLFQTLEPPSGGLERFRQRLKDVDAQARSVPGRRALAAGLAAALVAVVVVTVNWSPGSADPPGGSNAGSTTPTIVGSQETPTVNPPREATLVPGTTTNPDATIPSEPTVTRELADLREAPAFARLLGQPIRSNGTRVAINDMQVAVAELPSTNTKIRIYQVSNN
jgi:hypothetical protein